MTKHLDKKDVRKPDLITEELKKGFQWTTSHTKIVGVVIGLFFLSGIAYSFLQYRGQEKEAVASAKFALVEKEYLKKKEDFEKAQATPANKGANKGNDKIKAGEKAEATLTEKATGDLDKDYGNVLQDFQKVMTEHAGTKAAMLSAMTMNEIYLKYQKHDLALQNIEKLKAGRDSVSALLLSQKGTIQANMNDCKSAVQTWEQIIKMKVAQYIHPDILLKQALCYESLNEHNKAEESFNKVIAEAKDGSIGKTAEKYLRILKSQIKSQIK